MELNSAAKIFSQEGFSLRKEKSFYENRPSKYLFKFLKINPSENLSLFNKHLYDGGLFWEKLNRLFKRNIERCKNYDDKTKCIEKDSRKKYVQDLLGKIKLKNVRKDTYGKILKRY